LSCGLWNKTGNLNYGEVKEIKRGKYKEVIERINDKETRNKQRTREESRHRHNE
jgi:hypothetical protein